MNFQKGKFKVFGTVCHRDGVESRQWKPMGKSIANLYRYPEVSKACSTRFPDTMVDIVPVKSTLDEIGTVCTGKTAGGKKVTGFNVGAAEVVRRMETVSDGRFLIKGFRNKDIAETIFSKYVRPTKTFLQNQPDSEETPAARPERGVGFFIVPIEPKSLFNLQLLRINIIV